VLNLVASHRFASLIVVVVIPDPFPIGTEARSNSTKIQQSGHASRSGPEIKDKEVMPKWLTGEAQMRDNPEVGELGPAVDDRRRIASC